jgi:endonuclease YncB( thermonuclease family)
LSLVLAMMIALAWGYARLTDGREMVTRAPQEEIRAADGDSFTIGKRKLRLKGIDAPEYSQTCIDASGNAWDCGKAAQGALITLLAQPGLTCEAEAVDRFGRSLAICETASTPDIAASLVVKGMATSKEFYGLRDYPDEEDAAQAAKRGIWQGSFTHPSEWRREKPKM